MISGLWGSKRRGSTAATTPPESEIHVPHYIDTSREKNKLAEMVEEVTSTRLSYPTVQHEERELRESESGSASTARPNGAGAARDHVAEQVVQVNDRIPDPTGAYESPVKTSINDGIIDIDVPLPEYLSFESAVSSPSSSGFSFGAPGLGWGLGNVMEGFEHYSRTGPDTDTTLNVGGWLPRYHPDFALQAIPRQEDLMDELKASMRAEPTPALSSLPHHDPEESCGRWVEVCSAIVADATTFAIKHIRYRRLVKPINFDRSATSPLAQSHDSKYGNVYTAAALTPNIDVYERPVEERFIEEPIISMDETLIEAVERITAQSRQCSKGSSVCSSRPSSRQGRKPERSKSIPAKPDSIKETHVGDGAGSIDEARLEVPRNECKKMILTALEEIVRSVVDSRERDARADENGPPQMVDRERERESFLREGVRAWLGSVESAE
jgi:hypothetical protein